MKMNRAILLGVHVWVQIFIAFIIVLSFIPEIKNSQIQQGLVVSILTIPFTLIGAYVYYYKGSKTNSLKIGLVILIVALILDAIITVPFIEIPYRDSSYLEFFTNPLLLFIALEIIAVVYLFWKFKIKSLL